MFAVRQLRDDYNVYEQELPHEVRINEIYFKMEIHLAKLYILNCIKILPCFSFIFSNNEDTFLISWTKDKIVLASIPLKTFFFKQMIFWSLIVIVTESGKKYFYFYLSSLNSLLLYFSSFCEQ